MIENVDRKLLRHIVLRLTTAKLTINGMLARKLEPWLPRYYQPGSVGIAVPCAVDRGLSNSTRPSPIGLNGLRVGNNPDAVFAVVRDLEVYGQIAAPPVYQTM